MQPPSLFWNRDLYCFELKNLPYITQYQSRLFPKEKIKEILINKNAQNDTIAHFIELTENCEQARYAPSSSVAMQHDYDKAVLVITELEKQIG